MDTKLNPPKSITTRRKCPACYKQFKKKEHLIHHFNVSFHSVHQPKCGVCKKYLKTLESLREHLLGTLAKADCAEIFRIQGCNTCLKIIGSSDLSAHKDMCRLSPTALLEPKKMPYMDVENMEIDSDCTRVPTIALDCEFVGGKDDGTFNICAKVCLIDEDENVIFHSYIQPYTTITNYRHEITGITKEHLEDAMTHKEVQDKIKEILFNGKHMGRTLTKPGKARLLVGHNLQLDLKGLGIDYPNYLRRDTSRYCPLKKTNYVSHSLKYLTKTYLGYDIQQGTHNPYEDCVAAMRLYKRMRNQVHLSEEDIIMSNFVKSTPNAHIFDSFDSDELMDMSPDALLDISRPKYRCWCLDTTKELDAYVENAGYPITGSLSVNVQSVDIATHWLSIEDKISEAEKIDSNESGSWNVPVEKKNNGIAW